MSQSLQTVSFSGTHCIFLYLHFTRMIGVAKLAEKLGIGATFPNLTLNLVGGGTLDLPSGLDAKYRIILFYRGHW